MQKLIKSQISAAINHEFTDLIEVIKGVLYCGLYFFYQYAGAI